MLSERMRIAVIGMGNAGRQHIAAIRSAASTELHSVLERDPNVDLSSYPRASSWEALLEDEHLDCLALCIPPGRRKLLAEQAVRAGKAVMLEKPPAMTVGELKEMIDFRAHVGVMLQHRRRLPPAVVGPWPGDSVGTLMVVRHRPPGYFTGWRAEANESLGGITTHLGIHYLDLACQALGEVRTVNVTERRSRFPGIDERCGGSIQFESGACLTFIIAADVAGRREELNLVSADKTLRILDGAVSYSVGDELVLKEAIDTSVLRSSTYDDFTSTHDCHQLTQSLAVTKVMQSVADQLGA